MIAKTETFFVESDYSIFDWIVSGKDMLATDLSVSRHLDSCFADDGSSPEIFRAIAVYENTVEFVRSKNLAVQTSLVFPLEIWGDRLSMIVPKNTQDLIGMLDKFEPPSIYLLRQNFSYLEHSFEEYRLNLPKEIVSSNLADLKVLYREFRDEDSFYRGWEFARVLYISTF
jgi:hypothetical protein